MVEEKNGFQVVANLIMILLSLFCIFPFLLLIVSSVTEESSLILNGYSFFATDITFTAYRYLLVDSSGILRGYMISGLVTIIGTVANLTVTTLFAYGLSRKDLPGRGLFSFYLFFTMLFNGGLIPSYIMWTQVFHIKNTLLALIIPNLLMNAFYVIMMRTYFTINIPDAVIEAARIDGAGELFILPRIVLPMSLPIIATLAVLAGIGYWNDWLNGLYYTNVETLYGIQVLLNKMLLDAEYIKRSTNTSAAVASIAATLPSTGIKMAVAVMGALPILAFYLFFQKFFVKGIVIGAVKG